MLQYINVFFLINKLHLLIYKNIKIKMKHKTLTIQDCDVTKTPSSYLLVTQRHTSAIPSLPFDKGRNERMHHTYSKLTKWIGDNRLYTQWGGRS